MALDYLPFKGILIVYSLEALLFLEQRFESRIYSDLAMYSHVI